MAWLILIVSGAFEAVFTVSPSRTEGFTRPIPIIVFLVAVIISMGALLKVALLLGLIGCIVGLNPDQ
ncbi:SMR family transporter [Mycolicibacterium thermoresistibile]|jgi:multidrug transporter EmrE-like cation transporter|uniref:Small multidrug resistance protein n=2 Tax=Mycolicibacterium thermoresistibile TaxID=1797 RepID=G7CNR0_MYCT3|nr:SMR family transporter [Mycolicibacterium thermoresistibile]EHI10464.1 small multidrug resistance protein [Mycolicibacterium thermoresistibile ATCC 19527]MCV7187607.1 hypothetical protein [Mycolicibacterium thermoresistibile]GAT13658.1 small multidrug resistance protein [Mycolicibacterium thermoresistibile]SNW17298.1 small multidrug resistance protein [Mycolicibacterium thermoresistibile]